MLLPNGTVFAIVDGENFELYRNTGAEAEPRLAAMDVPELEATNFSAGARRLDGPTRHQARTGDGSNDALDESAHVAAVTGWLNSQVLSREIDQLVVVADPRSLGEMRRHYHKQLKDVLVAEVPKNLAGRPAQEITRILHG
ncbi:MULTISPECIES: baeRF12 domain-containing protein [Sphingomonadaceae]|uniref:AtsE n=1 Tax=Novosphingobium resinovorum TaxID=158500 RepID=A0A031K7Z9_9SPHN|nr:MULTISPECIES: host attachment protein [Sphingomonadaceae]AOR78454.1 attachment protein [Novosphingobium resinovorum]EJU10282.1 AtsE [Sphingomonas sp. LH128]EZP84742.1 AtsE [Novosphingobium resinovorum]MBF7011107.1 host attachment protein [Novosphingobium sp. HR1a]MEE4450859.1 host attachment protein [Novosphingobium resinovorum]